MAISATASASAGMVTAAVMRAPARLDNGPALLAFRQMLAGRDCGDEASAGHVIVVVAFATPTVIAGLNDVSDGVMRSSSAAGAGT